MNIGSVRPVQAPAESKPAESPVGGTQTFLDPETIAAWLRAMTPERVGFLTAAKGWTARTVRGLELGFVPGPAPEAGRVAMLRMDDRRRLLGFVRYQPSKESLSRSGHPKLLATGPRELWPAPESLPPGDVWLVEGEPDRVSAVEIGLMGVSVPGIGKWAAGWAERFKGRRVTVCLDCDEACCDVARSGGGIVEGSPACSACGAPKRRSHGGRDQARKIAGDLHAANVDARHIDLFPGRDDGYDLGDALTAATHEGRVDDLRRYLLRLEDHAWKQAA